MSFTNNPILISLYDVITQALRPYRINSHAIKKNRSHAIEAHNEIIEALNVHDVDRASKAIEKHITTSLKDMENLDIKI